MANYQSVNLGALDGNVLQKTGGIDFKDSLGDLEEYEGNLITFLTTMPPQSNHLFITTDLKESEGTKILVNSAYRIRNIQLPGISLDFKTDVVTRAPIFQDVTYETDVTIGWIDDVYKTVWRYHEDWIKRWYNKDYDVVRVGPQGKFRQLNIITYGYFSNYSKDQFSDKDDLFAQATPVPIMYIKVGGLVPIRLDGVKADKENDGATELYIGKYKCSRCQVFYNKLFCGTGGAYPALDGNYNKIGNNSGQQLVAPAINKAAEAALIAQTAVTTYGKGQV